MPKDKPLLIGIDLGGTNIAVGLVDHNDKVIARTKTKTKADEGSDAVVKRIVAGVGDVCAEGKISLEDVTAVGIGAPGAIDMQTGTVLKAVNLGWENFPLAKVLGKELPCPVVVDNDVNVGTWGELKAGAAKAYDDVLGIFVGTGIGGGLVLGGRLYHGARHTAGEIGHTVVLADGGLGRRTLENMASRTACVNLLQELIRASHPSAMLEIVDGDLGNIRSKALAKAVKQDDPLTLTVLKQAAHYVGVSVANTVTLLSLPCVILGGGVVEAVGEPFVEWVRAAFKQHVFPADLADCAILASKLGDDAGLIGAALLARDRLGKTGA